MGRNAFAHEAGIHQDGYLKEKTTYEIIDPKTVGVPEGKLVLGKHSGRHALNKRCRGSGVRPYARGTGRASIMRFTAAGGSQEGPDGRRDRCADSYGRSPAALAAVSGRLRYESERIWSCPATASARKSRAKRCACCEHVAREVRSTSSISREGLLGGIAIHKTGTPFPEETAQAGCWKPMRR